MVGHMMNFYDRMDTRVAEWRSEMYSTTRIPNEWAIQSIYLGIMAPSALAYLPDTVTQYSTGNVHVLIGAFGSIREMGDLKSDVRRIQPRYAFLLTPPRIVGSSRPEVWSDVREMDSEAFGNVVVGTWEFSALAESPGNTLISIIMPWEYERWAIVTEDRDWESNLAH